MDQIDYTGFDDFQAWAVTETFRWPSPLDNGTPEWATNSKWIWTSPSGDRKVEGQQKLYIEPPTKQGNPHAKWNVNSKFYVRNAACEWIMVGSHSSTTSFPLNEGATTPTIPNSFWGKLHEGTARFFWTFNSNGYLT